MRLRRAMLLIFLVLAGIILGGFVATACVDTPGLSWLSYSRHVGINPDAPFMLDLSILRFVFGFALNISVAQVLCVSLCLVIYNLVIKWKS